MLKTSLEPGKGFQGLKKDWKCTSRSLFSALTSIVFVLSGAIPMPVSYTHLDVYKRQILRYSAGHPFLL